MHDQLQKLQGLLLTTLPDYEAQVETLKATVTEEQTNREKAIAAEQLATKAVQIERDSYREQMEFYKSALKASTKKRSFGCTLKKVFTLGISGCR